MKKINYLVVLMVALVTVFTSCEKENGDDDLIVPAGLTVADLVGDWDFVSIKVDGTVYTDPCNSVLANDEYANIYMYFHDVTTTGQFVLGGDCDGWEGDYELTITNVSGKYIISWSNDNYQYEVLNASTVKTNGELMLKLVHSTATNYPVGAIYTLAK